MVYRDTGNSNLKFTKSSRSNKRGNSIFPRLFAARIIANARQNRQREGAVQRPRNPFAFRLGAPPCRGIVSLRSSSLEEAFCSGKDLLESYARQTFASWLLYRAPMICARANPQLTPRSFSLSIPAMILTPHSSKSSTSEAGIRTDVLRLLPITID